MKEKGRFFPGKFGFINPLLAAVLCLIVYWQIEPQRLVQKWIKEYKRVQYEKYLNQHPYHNRPLLTTEDLKQLPKQDRPDLAAEQNFLMTLDPALGYPPTERLLPVYREVREYIQANPAWAPGDPGSPWVERGPSNIAGRTRGVMFDPNDSNNKKVFAGGVSGGIWYNDDITNANQSWVKVDDFMANLAISSLAYDPNSTQVFYAGTGEGWYNADAVRGAGIWKSTDGGATWDQLAGTNNSDFYYVQKVMVHPVSSDVYAATRNNGVQRSTDGGTTWQEVLGSGAGALTNRAADIEFAADNSLYAAMGFSGSADGVYHSTTGNLNSWTKLNDGANIFPTSNIQRIELAAAPSDEDVIYAAVQGSGSGIEGLYRSDDQGATWTSLALPDDADQGIPNDDFTREQAWYDLIMAVDPANPANVIVGAVNLFRSTNSGADWSQISKWSNNPDMNLLPVSYVHADQHAIVYRPGSSGEVVFSTDDGVFYTDAIASAASSDVIEVRNKDYNVTQFYACAIHPTVATDYFLAGAQDNGSQQFDSPGIDVTVTVTGGDGAFCFVDQTDPTYQLTSYVWNNYRRSTNSGASFSAITSDNSGWFINPADYDDHQDILYSARDGSTLKRISGITSASVTEGTVSIPGLGSTATHIRVSPHTTGSSTLFVGTDAGRIFKVTNAEGGSPASTDIDPSSTLPAGTISCIEVGANENELLATFSNYGVTSVWYTSDGGTNWASKEGDLPDMPVRWALFNPVNLSEVILATEVGVWSTLNFDAGSPAWTPSNSGLANVRVDMFQIRDSDYEVIAATHGRGLYSSDGFGLAAPELSLSQNSVTFYVPVDGADSQPLTISNLADPGAANLNWNMTDQIATVKLMVNSDPDQAAGMRQRSKNLTGSSYSVEAETINRPSNLVIPPIPSLENTISLVLDDGGPETLIGFGGIEQLWLNRFTPNASEFPFNLTEVQVAFYSGGTVSVQVGDLIDIYIYEDSDGDPSNGANHVGSINSVTVQTTSGFSVFSVSPQIRLDGPGDVLIAVVTQQNGGYASHPSALDLTTTAQRSWLGHGGGGPIADPPSLPVSGFDLIDNYGSPGNWMIRGYGESAIPDWLSENPNSGSTGPGDDEVVTISVDAAGLELGTYQRELVINTNDPNNPTVTVLVTLNVIEAITVNTKTFLEGPYNGASMNTYLGDNTLLPTSQPFDGSPWNYSGAESVGSIPAGVVDWVFLQLRSSAAGAALASRAAFVKSDGAIVDMDGSSAVSFNYPAGSYYIVIRQRNHLDIMSASAEALTKTSALYDFTTPAGKAFGTDPMKEISTDVFGMFAGDGNSDGSVTTADRVEVWRPQNGAEWDYTKFGDFNLDGGIDAVDLNGFWRVNENKVSGVPGGAANSPAGLKQANSSGLESRSVQGTASQPAVRK